MARGEFTKQEAAEIEKAVGRIYDDLPKGKKVDAIGDLNDIYLFLSAAKKVAPDEVM